MSVKQFFLIIAKCFYSKKLYISVFYKWQGICFKYLSLLLLLSILPSILYGCFITSQIDSNAINTYINDNSETPPQDYNINIFLANIIKQIPTIKIKSGSVNMETNDIINIYYPFSNYIFAIIDVSGSTKIDDNNVMFVLTKDKIYLHGVNGQVISYFISNLSAKSGDITIDTDYILNFIDNFKKTVIWILFLIMYPSLFISALFYISLKSILFSICGYLILINILRIKNVSSQSIYRLSIMSSTPGIIMNSILSLMPSSSIYIFGQWSIMILHIIYLCYSIYIIYKFEAVR